jgi:glycosyltransferase involved in cell wall biosynthesis
MRVLMVTQSVDLDDSVLGFTHAWIEALAHRVAQLHVVTPIAGRYDLPDNVTVHAWGPPGKASTRWQRARFYIGRFIGLIWKRRVDVVFVHMIPRWVLVAAPFCKLRGVPIVLWYSHRQVTLELKLAHRLASRVVTASPESYSLYDDRVSVVGHGIDTSLFAPAEEAQPQARSVVSVGRISPIKNYDVLIRAAQILVHERGQEDWRFTIVGGASRGAAGLESTLCGLVEQLALQRWVSFVGEVPNQAMPGVYRAHALSVNLCPTGGMDKVVLESMACYTVALVCNRTFAPLFGDESDRLIFREGDATDLADHLEALAELPERERQRLAHSLRERVAAAYSVGALMDRLVGVFQNTVQDK